jgi:hypothetical protein
MKERTYIEKWKSDRQFFSFWFCLKMRTIFKLQMFWIFKIRNPIKKSTLYYKFKKKTWQDSGYCFTGTNRTPTTIY